MNSLIDTIAIKDELIKTQEELIKQQEGRIEELRDAIKRIYVIANYH